MNRVYNFSAGPSMLPEAVLRRAAGEMLDYQGSGQSVMEMSHRSKVYEGIINSAESLLREVMNIPDNYKVLFLQGGASSQFAMVPMNLMTKNNKADFVITGQWATKAYKEAARYGDANVVASSKDKTFSYIPELDPASFDQGRGLFPHLHEQHHLRHEIPYPARHRQRAAGRGHLLLHPERAHRRQQIRPALRRRTEEHGACRPDGGDYP